jgi:Bacterial archaeo-eukaryotic release factor family 11
MLYTDIPTTDEIRALDAARGGVCVSIYLPTTPITRSGERDRILFKNLSNSALEQLREAKASKKEIAALETSLSDLEADKTFWAYMADGLAVFATPTTLRTYRLPLAPKAEGQVADRFHIMPLVPVLAHCGHCFVLALSQGAARFIEVTPSFAREAKVADLPRTMSDAVKRSLPRDRAPSRRLQGGEGMKVLMAQYCRAVDRALRPVLIGQSAPLIIAAVSELAAIYRAQNSYPLLLKSPIGGNPEEISDADLARTARSMISRREKKEMSESLASAVGALGRDLASADLEEICHAAVRGQVETLFIDGDANASGRVDRKTGKLTLSKRPSANTYDVFDELVGLVLRNGGQVIPAKAKSMPADSKAMATFRYRS